MNHKILIFFLPVVVAIALTACSGTSSILSSFPREEEEEATTIDPAAFSAFFPKDSIWSTDISNAPMDAESQTIINYMASHGNWGGGHIGWWPHNWLRISTEWRLLKATRSTPFVPFQKASGYYHDCDQNLTSFPTPVGGGIQGVPGYEACASTLGADCHLIVYDQVNKKLYESYATDYINGKVSSQCGIVWDTSKVYPIDGRGEQCTSTDAAGLPSGALLFTADDLAAGHIDHALRVTLPNTMLRKMTYVHPATHASTAPSAGAGSPIYGNRFRLKASVDISGYSPAMQVILTAMKKYGMIISDGGDVAISAADDRDTVHKYSEFNLNVDNALASLTVDKFEIVDGGARIPLTFGCVQNGQ